MKLLILTILILCPIDPPKVLVPVRVSDEEMWYALKQIAWQAEISGPRCPWITDFRSEFFWVKRRWNEVRSFPSIQEIQRLPPFEVCRDYVKFGEAHRSYLCAIEAEKRYRPTMEYRLEVGRMITFWELASSAQNGSSHWFFQREKLSRIKELVGDEVFYSGRWPPPAPLWNWQER